MGGFAVLPKKIGLHPEVESDLTGTCSDRTATFLRRQQQTTDQQGERAASRAGINFWSLEAFASARFIALTVWWAP
jgi:hypothetical protein